MRTAIFAFFFLCITGAAFGQTAAVVSANPQPLHMAEHAEQASEHGMAQETSLFSHAGYSYARGEVPLAELGSPLYHAPLGDVARAAKKEHANDPKATRVFEN